MIASILFIAFAVLLIVGAPIAVCLGSSSILAMLAQGAGHPIDTIMSSLPRLFAASSSKFVLLAIPFFILAGNIMEKAGISERLINLAEACVGHVKGGLAIVCVVVACFFAAISGSGPATVAALGLVLIPGMIKTGYNAPFSAALMGCAGAIGVIIPPSITFVVYGSIADTSIGDLFKAGVIPGLIMGAGLIITALLVGRKMDLKRMPKASGKVRWKAFKDAFWGLLMPIIILGGIYAGVFTPTEAAVVAVFYGFIIGVFVYKEINFKTFLNILKSSTITTAIIMFVICSATAFGKILTIESIPNRVATWIIGLTNSKFLLLLLINILLLIVGCFMEATSSMLILAPIFLPVIQEMGVDPIHFGIIMVINLSLGMATPPVGANLYVACNISKGDIGEISKSVIGPIAVAVFVLLLVTYIEPLSMLLPRLLG